MLSSPYHARTGTKKLFSVYICKADGLDEVDAVAAVLGEEIVCYGRVKIPVVDRSQDIRAVNERRHRHHMLRSDWYITAEFLTEKQTLGVSTMERRSNS